MTDFLNNDIDIEQLKEGNYVDNVNKVVLVTGAAGKYKQHIKILI